MTDINQQSDVIIIGGVAAGPKTAATLARRLPGIRITVFQKEKNVSYGSCGLPYFASGDINSFEDLTKTSYDIPRTPEFFRRSKGFEVVTEAEVTAIDRENKTVTVNMTAEGKTVTHEYKTLVIATGAVPNHPPFPIVDSPRISHFTRPRDALDFRSLAETGQVGTALIVGGGFIGCEVAEATASLWGIETTLVEKENQVLPYVLDPEMAAIVEREMARQEIEVITGAAVEKIECDGDGNPVVHIGGRDPIAVDYVFLCLGVHPETTLAQACGLKIGETGGIAVDPRLRTSDPNIYAGGDCIESVSKITHAPLYIPMGSLANRHGRVIAENIAGNETEFKGALGAFLVKVFDMNVGAVGLSTQAADRAGIASEAVWGSFPDKPDYYPESHTMTLKLIYEAASRRVLGLQACGTGDICRRVDSLSALMQNGAGLDDLLAFEHGYAPPYAEALDPLHHLAAIARAKTEDGYIFENPGDDFIPRTGDNIIWLDVREPEEIEQQAWPYAEGSEPGKYINIPLNDLRERLDELDRKSKIMLICKRGPRSYQSAVILRQAGFSDVRIIAGGYQASQQ